MKILIVEDEIKTGEYLSKGLTEAGFVVDHADNGLTGYHLAMTAEYDLVILDIMLPDVNGWDIIRMLRTAGKGMPVLLLTALGTIEHRVKGLELGADDYLVKPFDVVELLARVEVVLRRFHKRGAQLSAGDVVVDMEARMVMKAGVPVVLTNKEYGLLVLFIQNKNIALFKESLYEKVWGEEYDGDSRTLELHVQRLRKKMGWENQLVAVYKVGYRLEIA